MSKDYISNGIIEVLSHNKTMPINLDTDPIPKKQMQIAERLGFKDDDRYFELNRFSTNSKPAETVLVNSTVGQMIICMVELSAWIKENSIEALRNTPKQLNAEELKDRRSIRKQRELNKNKLHAVQTWLKGNLGNIYYRFID